MKTITVEEITALYRNCGLNASWSYGMRTEINTGTLNNRLNANYDFLNRASSRIIASNYYSEEYKRYSR